MGLGKLIKEKLDQIKYPHLYCSVCKKELEDDIWYECRYCGKRNCEHHRPPQNHKCRKDKRRMKFGSFRELHDADGSVVASGV